MAGRWTEHGSPHGDTPPVGIVMMTRDRRERVLATLPRILESVPRGAQVVVVDNGSRDGTVEAVRRDHPCVQVIPLPTDLGAPARNLGVEVVRAEVVAFADDDSWWAPGSLECAVELFASHPRLALVAARVLVGPDERLDPVSATMASSPLGRDPDLPGPSVLGFVACGSVVRRSSFLAVGGFDPTVHFAGEEERVALDLAAAGWGLAYVPDVVAHHHPGVTGRRPGRDALVARNALLTACMRRPVSVVAARARRAPLQAVLRAVPRLPGALARRRRVPAWLEDRLAVVETTGGTWSKA